jgi:hypothetical protein
MLNLYTFVDGHPLADCGVEWLCVGYGHLLPLDTPYRTGLSLERS